MKHVIKDFLSKCAHLVACTEETLNGNYFLSTEKKKNYSKVDTETIFINS